LRPNRIAPLAATPARRGSTSPRLASVDVIAVLNGASADMCILGDHGKVADLRIAID